MSTQKNDAPPAALNQLATLLNLPRVTTWDEAKQVFSRWGRKPGQERWELNDVRLGKDQEKVVTEKLKQLGFIDAIPATKNQYDYAVILGGTVPSMIKRFNYLINQWQSGVRFKQIVFLVGYRPLSDTADKFVDNIKRWSPSAKDLVWNQHTLPLDETEAAELIYAMASLPESMKSIPVKYYRTPRSWQPKHKQWQRANTNMTVHTWLKEQPVAGSVLVVSSQPSAHYQHQVFINTMPSDFTVETIAPTCPSTTSFAVILDAVWLWIKNQ